MRLLALSLLCLANSLQKYSEKLDITEFTSGSCSESSCEHCCLSTYQCGNLDQCRSRAFPVLFFELYYYSIVLICLGILAIQCYNKGKGVNSRG